MKKLSFLLAVIYVVSSCNKSNEQNTDDSSVKIDGVFKSTNNLNIISAEMYTRAGKVTDVNVISSFVNRKGLRNVIYTDGTQTLLVDMPITITAGSDNKVTVTSPNPSQSFKAEILVYEKQYLKISSLDSVNYNMPLNPACSSRLAGLSYDMFESVKSCKTLPAPTGYNMQCKYKPLFALRVLNESTLLLPIISVYAQSVEKSGSITTSSCSFSKLNEWNIANPDFYKSLAQNDTVVVQEKQLILRK